MAHDFKPFQVYIFIRVDPGLAPRDGNLLFRGIHTVQVRKEQSPAPAS